MLEYYTCLLIFHLSIFSESSKKELYYVYCSIATYVSNKYLILFNIAISLSAKCPCTLALRPWALSACKTHSFCACYQDNIGCFKFSASFVQWFTCWFRKNIVKTEFQYIQCSVYSYEGVFFSCQIVHSAVCAGTNVLFYILYIIRKSYFHFYF